MTPVFLEVDSSFRDRKEWPNPAEFEIPLSISGRNANSLTAVDPVSTAAPLVSWRGNTFDLTQPYTSPTISMTAVASALDNLGNVIHASDNGQTSVFGIPTPPGVFQNIDNYYAGCNITLGGMSSRIITSYWNEDGSTLFNILTPFPLTQPQTSNIIISDSTNVDTTTMFVPAQTGSVDNEYVGGFLIDDTTGSFYPITAFKSISNTLSYLVSPGKSPPPSNHLFSIRYNAPNERGQLSSITPSTSNTTFILPESFFGRELAGSFLEVFETILSASGVLDPTLGDGLKTVALGNNHPMPDNFYTGYHLAPYGSPPRRITSYEASTTLVTLEKSFLSDQRGVAFVVAPIFSTCRQIQKFVSYRGELQHGTTQLSLVFPESTASSQNGYYNNLFIKMKTGAAAGEVRQIFSYYVTVAGKIAYLNNGFSVPVMVGDLFVITSGYVAAPFPFSLYLQSFNILPFSYDNLNPFNFTGTKLEGTRCRQLTLLSLGLPNLKLQSGTGGLIAFYPYIYVTLINQNYKAAYNSLPSNNTNAASVTFRIVLGNVLSPLQQRFVNLGGYGVSLKLPFTLYDNLLFRVTLPTGEVFQTIQQDNISPIPVNPKLQISALFRID